MALPGLEAQLPCTSPALTVPQGDYDQLYESFYRQYVQLLGSEVGGGILRGPPPQAGGIPIAHDKYACKVEVGDGVQAACTKANALPMKLTRLVPMKLKLPMSDDDEMHDASAKPAEIGDTLKAACAAAFELVPTRLTLTPPDGQDSGAATSKGASLGRWAIANSVTTLQCHGLDRNATLEELVLALNAEGLAGCYNFVSIPRRLHGEGLGYAFINFTTPEGAAMLVEKWQGVPCPHACLGRRVRFSAAEKQGYHKHVSTKGIRKFDRIRNTALWPLVMSEDGRAVVFGSEEAIAATLAHPSSEVAPQ